jgi:hypothetical protein
MFYDFLLFLINIDKNNFHAAPSGYLRRSEKRKQKKNLIFSWIFPCFLLFFFFSKVSQLSTKQMVQLLDDMYFPIILLN